MPHASGVRRREALWIVLAGGLVAGTLDLLFAWSFWAIRAEVPPTAILQSIAAGLLGPASRQGGALTALLGAVLHYLIAATMAVTYASVALRFPVLVRQPVRYGALYGGLLYVVMNHVVVPLSRAGPGSRLPLWVGLSIVVHLFLIGVPMALAARRALAAVGDAPRG